MKVQSTVTKGMSIERMVRTLDYYSRFWGSKPALAHRLCQIFKVHSIHLSLNIHLQVARQHVWLEQARELSEQTCSPNAF